MCHVVYVRDYARGDEEVKIRVFMGNSAGREIDRGSENGDSRAYTRELYLIRATVRARDSYG